MNFQQTESSIGYVFRDKTLLRKALTLSSLDAQFNNQSLECLGDAILSFVVAEKYYFEGYDEGEITQMKRALVSDSALAPVSERLGLDKALLRGKGDDHNKKAVPSVYEAVAAAIYIDGGMESAKKFILETLDFSPRPRDTDYISALQELMQSRGKRPPHYEKQECGTPKHPRFRAVVRLDGREFSGEEDSFSAAKKIAAKLAYAHLNQS